MLFVIDNLLSPGTVQRISRLIGKATFIDGRATAGVSRDVKNNREMGVSEIYLELTETLEQAIESSVKINMRVLPRFRTNPIINRYDVGMFYAEHIDEPIQGRVTQVGRTPGRFGQSFLRTDYSMTVFLSDPGDYDGGELDLRLLEDRKLVKLPAGSAVCYSTGIRHSVRPVTRGTRVAAIYWFQSLIRDVQLRKEVWEQYCLEESLNLAGQQELALKASTIRSNLIRYLADV